MKAPIEHIYEVSISNLDKVLNDYSESSLKQFPFVEYVSQIKNSTSICNIDSENITDLFWAAHKMDRVKGKIADKWFRADLDLEFGQKSVYRVFKESESLYELISEMKRKIDDKYMILNKEFGKLLNFLNGKRGNGHGN